jgi:hypothetical protein
LGLEAENRAIGRVTALSYYVIVILASTLVAAINWIALTHGYTTVPLVIGCGLAVVVFAGLSGFVPGIALIFSLLVSLVGATIVSVVWRIGLLPPALMAIPAMLVIADVAHRREENSRAR